MSQHKIIRLIDDIDGSDAAETISFGLDGKDYEIDLSETHATALRENLADYIEYARKVGGKKTRRGSNKAKATLQLVQGEDGAARPDPAQAAAVRDWARRNGHEVNGRGRIAKPVLEAFAAAH